MATMQELTRDPSKDSEFDARFGKWVDTGVEQANQSFKVPGAGVPRMPVRLENILTPEQIKARKPTRGRAEADPVGGLTNYLAANKPPERGFAEWLGTVEAQPHLAAAGFTGGHVRIGERLGEEFNLESIHAKDLRERYGTKDAYLNHQFNVTNEKGDVVGEISLDIEGGSDPSGKEARTGYVQWVGSIPSEGASAQSWTIGPKAIRSLIKQIKEIYPNLDTLHATRVSGARAESGKTERPGGAEARFDISKYSGLPWAVLPTGAILFGNDEAKASEPGLMDKASDLLHSVAQSKALRLPQAIVNAIGQVGKEHLDDLVGNLERSYAAEARGEHDPKALTNLAMQTGMLGVPISRAAGTVADLGAFASTHQSVIPSSRVAASEAAKIPLSESERGFLEDAKDAMKWYKENVGGISKFNPAFFTLPEREVIKKVYGSIENFVKEALGSIENFVKEALGAETVLAKEPTQKEALRHTEEFYKAGEEAKNKSLIEGAHPDDEKILKSLPHSVVGKYHSDFPEFLMKNVKGVSITRMDAAVLSHYIGSGAWELNRQLRSGNPTPEYWTFANTLKSALEKFPTYRGTVWRGVSNKTYHYDQYIPGYEFDNTAFMSTAKEEEAAFAKSVRFIISGRTGRNLSDTYVNIGESEILFAPGSRFRVIKREPDWENENIDIYLEEIQ